jgi:hypothetical protein
LKGGVFWEFGFFFKPLLVKNSTKITDPWKLQVLMPFEHYFDVCVTNFWLVYTLFRKILTELGNLYYFGFCVPKFWYVTRCFGLYLSKYLLAESVNNWKTDSTCNIVTVSIVPIKNPSTHSKYVICII